MDVSRINQGRIELKRERVDVAQVIALAVEATQSQIDEGGQELKVHLPERALMLDADPTRLVQVFVNLLTNAAKYTDRNGCIDVRVSCREPDVEVCVKDNGIGISRQRLHDIFAMFTQVPEAAGRSRGGLGIGLSLVRYLVELHGGSVVAHSDGPGRGSAFTVSLPLASPCRTSDQASPPATEHVTHAPKGLRILVVDDNRAGADTLAELLTILDHEVEAVYDGETALARVLAAAPDVVLLDIGLPDIDGYEVCRRVREEPSCKAVTLIALTGWGDTEAKSKGHAAGFAAHLVKPVEEDALMAAITLARAQP